jgi:hypothetical protein
MRHALALLLLAPLASAQIRSAPAYDGSAPGHPADEPGPELGANADDAFALLSRGDRDAARLSAARCLRGDSGDERCRIVVEAVEAGIDAPKLPARRADLYRADVHFRAGADWYFHDESADARREWEACRRLDPGNPFCALGLKLLGADRAQRSSRRAAPKVAAPESLGPSRDGQQRYLEGLIWFQKGDYEKARQAWAACSSAPGEAGTDCRVGLAKLQQLFGAE